jgi:hypothetical protein
MVDASGEPVQVSIELDSGPGAVSGTISVAGGPPTPFFGWMEFAHAIDLARRFRATEDDRVTGDGQPPS